MKTFRWSIFLLATFFSRVSFANPGPNSICAFFPKNELSKEPLLKVKVRKSGPYFGLQQGAYLFAELGGEMQFKRMQFKKATTQAINGGAMYNLVNNVLGFNLGAWMKQGRFDFTYGINLAYRTDFEQNRFGGGPVLGYKIWGFHLLAGFDFIPKRSTFSETNNLYVAARFLLVNNRDTKWTWRKKEKTKSSD